MTEAELRRLLRTRVVWEIFPHAEARDSEARTAMMVSAGQRGDPIEVALRYEDRLHPTIRGWLDEVTK